jgi:hypothetical protein
MCRTRAESLPLLRHQPCCLSAEGAAWIEQTVSTVTNGTYMLSFAFAGDGLAPSSPHHSHAPSFKSMSVFWNDAKAGVS